MIGAQKIVPTQSASMANDGGEGGIRTLGRGKPTHAFQACAFNRSATSPPRRKAREQWLR